MSGAAPTTTRMLSVFDGRVCVGFLIERGKEGVELFDADQKSLGIYPTQKAAVAALDTITTKQARP